MLRSTFAGFSMAQQALNATQRAIDVAGQNLSNINTRGYTRQRLDLASITPVGTSYSSSSFDNKVGQGVMMNGISQIRDPFLDVQYRNQISKVGTVDAEDQILQKIGEIFDETDREAIRSALNDVVSQLRSMSNVSNAGESSSDTLVRSAFEVLLNAVHQNASAVDDVESDVISKLEDSLIPGLNTCLEEIQKLNKTIKNSQVLGNPSLELLDQRNQLLDDLASYLPIRVTYNTDSSTGEKIDLLQVTFKDTEGNTHTLISDDKAAEFQFDSTGGIPVSLTIKDALDPTGAVSTVDVADLLGDGVLKGNLDMLNHAEIFDGSDTKGIGYYRGMFDAFASQMVERMNYLNAEKDADGNVTTPHDLFQKIDPDKPFSASNIKIADDWKNGTVTLKKWDNPELEGNSSVYDNILRMINELTTDTHTFTVDRPGGPVTVFTGTIQGCYDNIQNIQGIERKATSSILQNHLTVLNQIEDSRDAVSGVNLDEEVMDLMRYQQSYNAASRLMTTLDQMIDKLINDTGVVGR